MTVCHENTELFVFGGGNGDSHKALLRGKALQPSLPASSCKQHVHSQDDRLASTTKAVWAKR